jgi:hypothetical protein
MVNNYSIFDMLFKPLFIKGARFNGFTGRLCGPESRGMKFVSLPCKNGLLELWVVMVYVIDGTIPSESSPKALEFKGSRVQGFE